MNDQKSFPRTLKEPPSQKKGSVFVRWDKWLHRMCPQEQAGPSSQLPSPMTPIYTYTHLPLFIRNYTRALSSLADSNTCTALGFAHDLVTWLVDGTFPHRASSSSYSGYPTAALTFLLLSFLPGPSVYNEVSPHPKLMAWAPTWSLRSVSTIGLLIAGRKRPSGRSWPWTPIAPTRHTAWTPCFPMAPLTTSPAPLLQTSFQVRQAAASPT